MTQKVNRHIVFDNDARSKVYQGVNLLADAVKVTMGPRGQNVVIEREEAAPSLTKDGVTVAEAINFRDRYLNLGAQIVKQAAAQTAAVAGDGTTTSTVLAHSIFKEGLRLMSAGHSSADIQKGIKLASKSIVENLISMALPITKNEEVVQVGTISANGENEIGELLGQAMQEVGRDGIIQVEEAKGFQSHLEILEGYQVDRGYISPYFINDKSDNKVQLKNPKILVADKTIKSLKDIMQVLEKAHQSQESLIIFANDIEGDALQGLVLNASKGILNVCAMRNPGFGNSRVDLIGDLCCMLNTEKWNGEDEIDYSSLGTCDKVIVYKDCCVFMGCNPNEELTTQRVDTIRSKLSDPTLTDNEVLYYNKRIADMSGGIAVLFVGGSTEVEMKERKDRVEDALHATQAAVEEGILPGGGVALAQASNNIKIDNTLLSESILAGIKVLQKSCKEPLLQIVRNTGGSPDVVLNQVLKHSQGDNMGYDASTEKFVNMLESGIIDPLKVVRTALENASSVACSLLSVGCAMIEDIEEEEENISPITNFA